MRELIDSMPGIELPVGDVTGRLAAMMDAEPDEPQSAVRASQMNLVLHFGLSVGAEEARACFDAAIRFSQRYPCRVIVLCPSAPGESDRPMRARLFSQCYIGASHREMCYCEALVLGYSTEDFHFLANQVSTWLEGDLPVCHWVHRVPSDRLCDYRDEFLARARRLVYDEGVEDGALEGFEWPPEIAVRDLAVARLLPVRQAIGQFLSGFDAAALVDGLTEVRAASSGPRAGEARRLLGWARGCLEEAGRRSGAGLGGVSWNLADGEDGAELSLEFDYADDRFFRWMMFGGRSVGEIDYDFGDGRDCMPTRVRLLKPDAALAEALFFA